MVCGSGGKAWLGELQQRKWCVAFARHVVFATGARGTRRVSHRVACPAHVHGVRVYNASKALKQLDLGICQCVFVRAVEAAQLIALGIQEARPGVRWQWALLPAVEMGRAGERLEGSMGSGFASPIPQTSCTVPQWPGTCQVHVRMCRSGQVHVHAPGGNQLDADERQGSCCCPPKNLFAAACSPKSGAVTKVICILAGIHHELLGHTAAQHARATHATSRFTGHKIKRQLYTRDTGAWKSMATVVTIVAIMVVAVSLAVRVAQHTSSGMWHWLVCVCVHMVCMVDACVQVLHRPHRSSLRIVMHAHRHCLRR